MNNTIGFEKRDKTIGFVTTSFPRHMGDSAGNFVFHMAEGFAQMGYKIDVVVPEPPPGQPTQWTDKTHWPPWLSVHPVRYMIPQRGQQLFFSNGVPDNLSASKFTVGLIPFAIWQLSKKIASLQPNWCAVVSHWLLPSALIAPRVANNWIPHLAIAHSGDVHMLRKLPQKRVIAGLIARRANALGFVSTQLRTEFRNMLPPGRADTPLHWTPMGVPRTRCTMTRQKARQKWGLSDFTVLFLGRLVPIKGVDVLIESAKNGAYKLLIAGDGAEQTRLQTLCKQNNVAATFVGRVDETQKNELLQAADALAVPSVQLADGRHEGIPMVLTEAMAAELPIVATDTGGIGDIIVHRHNGLLVPDGNPAELFKSLNGIKTDPTIAKSLICNAKEAANQRQWHFLIPKYHNLLFNC